MALRLEIDQEPQQPETAQRRREVPRWARWAVAGMVAAAAFWAAGGPTLWRSDPLARACGGVLASGPLHSLLPGGGEGGNLVTAERTARQLTRCMLVADSDRGNGRKASVTVAIAPSAAAPTLDGQSWAVPLGHGWTGSFALDPTGFAGPSVSVLLDCAGQDGGLLVSVVADGLDDFAEDPAKRRALAAAATGTAERAARERGCDARLGRPVTRVGLPVVAWQYEGAEHADGTCRGVLDEQVGDTLGVSTVLETAAGRSLNERCRLGGWRGAPLYLLTASYGPYAEELRDHGDYHYRADSPDTKQAREQGVYWTEARCPGGRGTALYRLMPEVEGPDGTTLTLHHKELRDVLNRFAAASAQRHGCATPRPL